MNQYIFVGISVLFLSLFNVLLKLLPPKIHFAYSIPFITLGAFLISLLGALIIPRVFQVENLQFSRQAALIALGMGSIWTLSQFSFLYLFFRNPDISVLTPILVGGVALGGSIAAILIYKEPITFFKVIGMFAIVLGVFFLSKK